MNNLESCEPRWLTIVLCGEDAAVEEDKEKDDPKHGLRLHCFQAKMLRLLVGFQKLLSQTNMPLIAVFMNIQQKEVFYSAF